MTSKHMPADTNNEEESNATAKYTADVMLIEPLKQLLWSGIVVMCVRVKGVKSVGS